MANFVGGQSDDEKGNNHQMVCVQQCCYAHWAVVQTRAVPQGTWPGGNHQWSTGCQSIWQVVQVGVWRVQRRQCEKSTRQGTWEHG